MKPQIKETPDQIVIDKAKVESITKRFLAAVKAFFVNLTGERIVMTKPSVEPVSIWKEVNEVDKAYDKGWDDGFDFAKKKMKKKKMSIWKDGDELKELEKQNEKFLIRTKDGRVLMPRLSNIFTDNNEINKNIKEATTLTDFINSFEQMQKDIEELKRKWQ